MWVKIKYQVNAIQLIKSPNQSKEGRFVLLTPLRGQGEVKLFLFEEKEWEQFKLGGVVELICSDPEPEEAQVSKAVPTADAPATPAA